MLAWYFNGMLKRWDFVSITYVFFVPRDIIHALICEEVVRIIH